MFCYILQFFIFLYRILFVFLSVVFVPHLCPNKRVFPCKRICLIIICHSSVWCLFSHHLCLMFYRCFLFFLSQLIHHQQLLCLNCCLLSVCLFVDFCRPRLATAHAPFLDSLACLHSFFPPYFSFESIAVKLSVYYYKLLPLSVSPFRCSFH